MKASAIQKLALAMVAAGALLGASAGPAAADEHEHEWHGRHEGWHHHHHDGPVVVAPSPYAYAPPPVIYAPPPAVYAPPPAVVVPAPVVVAPPPAGINVILPIHIR